MGHADFWEKQNLVAVWIGNERAPGKKTVLLCLAILDGQREGQGIVVFLG